MIASIRGIVNLVAPGEAIIEVGDIGYRVWVRSDLDYLYPGEPVNLRIRQVVKEDSNDLYGFELEAEEAIFLAITGIKGCGPRLAMKVLSGITTDEFKRAVGLKDVKALTAIKGVGARTALAIIEALSRGA
jgi:Holliday junction DNA helicase RuvA